MGTPTGPHSSTQHERSTVVWFKVDDKFHSSIEVMSIPVGQRAAAIGLWCLAGAWSCDQLKDGLVPGSLIEGWGATRETASALVKAKLWERAGRSDYQFRNWAKWQPTRAATLQKRAEVNERVRKSRSHTPRDTAESNADVTRYKSGVTPPPTRPDPTTVKGIGKSASVVTKGPWCARHPGGTDEACGPCRTARIAFEAAQSSATAATTVKAVTATPKRFKPADGHPHRVSPGGTHCELCETRITP